MKNTAFIISCKESNHIYNCVESIHKFYPDSTVYIVDSCSNDKSYFSLCSEKIVIEDICNKNYECGAYVSAFKKYGHLHDVFVFMQDSIKLNSTIKELDTINNSEVFTFTSENCGWSNDPEARDVFYQLNENFPDRHLMHFDITIWNSFIITSETFTKVLDSAIFNLAPLPDKKSLSRAWERVWSIIFKYNNILIKSIDNNQITKTWGART